VVLWVLLVFATLLAVEAFFRLPLGTLVTTLQQLLNKITHTIGTPTISDHWKEKVLPAYAGQLFMLSIKLFVVICLAVSPFFVLGAITAYEGVAFLSFLSTPAALTASTVLAIAYAIVRKRYSS